MQETWPEPAPAVVRGADIEWASAELEDSLKDAEDCARALGCRYDIVPIFEPVDAKETHLLIRFACPAQRRAADAAWAEQRLREEHSAEGSAS